jgi:hypothetical protein
MGPSLLTSTKTKVRTDTLKCTVDIHSTPRRQFHVLEHATDILEHATDTSEHALDTKEHATDVSENATNISEHATDRLYQNTTLI